MDRKAALEQKKKRLRELKQRRLDHDLSKSTDISGEDIRSDEKPKAQGTRVSVAIQTDLVFETEHNTIEQHTASLNDNVNREVFRPEKGIQVDGPLERTFSTTSSLNDNESSQSETSDDKLEPSILEDNEHVINSQVKDAFKKLGHILIETEHEIGYESSFKDRVREELEKTKSSQTELENPLKEIYRVSASQYRSARFVELSPHFNDLIAVCYGSNKSPTRDSMRQEKRYIHSSYTNSDGLVIIHKVKDSKMIPEFYLLANAAVSAISFSRRDPQKIIGGLNNGQVVIWNLVDTKHTQVAILPSLISPIYSTINTVKSNNNEINFIPHSSSICTIEQSDLKQGQFVTICSEGIVNIWSINLLACPRFNSLQIKKTDDRETEIFKDTILHIVKGIHTYGVAQSVMSYKSDDLSNGSTEYKVLNNMFLGCLNGELVKLSNKIENFIDFILKSDNKESNSSNILALPTVLSLKSIKLNDSFPFLISSALDMTIRIWDLKNKTTLVSIPITYLAFDIVVNPFKKAQFVTVGLFEDTNRSRTVPIIEFWDLKSKVMGSIYRMTLSVGQNSSSDANLYAVSALFRSENELVVGLNNGDIIYYSIDQQILLAGSDKAKHNEIHDGIDHYLIGI
ncbi:Piso0_005770 [Millerozyma farinosa CBS 7064]|uniref:Piso0_005770 protein n=1 Tax=Pichia sorbitophila (strain ATCC MYA-4447 / BCRC 22081 / CBS 7064 / NBRC 10061 / NRRL Y-12695) TaxID=559304 RepID=G8Y2V9_PICSO|nr:Piso0_005770 [Millerozyma farinosa CBS 7064]